MPIDYEKVAAFALIGERVCELIHESGLMVPRQKPGRKVEKGEGAKATKVAKATPVADPDDVETEDE